MAGRFGVAPHRSGGITLLVLDHKKIDALFQPGGITFRWMRNVAQEVDHLAVEHIVEGAKGYGKGVLETSISHSVTPAGARNLVSHVTSSDPNAMFVHQGVRPHRINPTVPLRRTVDGATGGLVFYWRRKGRVVRVPHVNHPGYEGNPFLTKALSEVLRLRGIKKL